MFVALLLVSIHGKADGQCGRLDGQATETDTASSVTRIITRFQTANGPRYTYELVFKRNVLPASGEIGSYRVDATLNGKTSVDRGVLYNTTENGSSIDGGGSVASDSCGNEGINTNTISPSLFFYAANEDHLNDWQGTFQVAGSKEVRFGFPQESFEELPWSN